MIITVFTTACHLPRPFLSQFNPVHTLPPFSLKMRLNINLSSMLRTYRRFFSFMVAPPPKSPEYTSQVRSTCPSHYLHLIASNTVSADPLRPVVSTHSAQELLAMMNLVLQLSLVSSSRGILGFLKFKYGPTVTCNAHPIPKGHFSERSQPPTVCPPEKSRM